MVVAKFNLLLTTKPGLVRFEVEGIATLTGKDNEIEKMLEVDPETKVPYIFHKAYQHAFTAMYLLSTILNVPPPPNDLLVSEKKEFPTEGISVETAKPIEGKPAEGSGQETKV